MKGLFDHKTEEQKTGDARSGAGFSAGSLPSVSAQPNSVQTLPSGTERDLFASIEEKVESTGKRQVQPQEPVWNPPSLLSQPSPKQQPARGVSQFQGTIIILLLLTGLGAPLVSWLKPVDCGRSGLSCLIAGGIRGFQDP